MHRKTTHNVTKFGVTPPPGRENCDSAKVPPETKTAPSPWPGHQLTACMREQLLGHYPFTKVTSKEIRIDAGTGALKDWARAQDDCL